MHWHFVQLWSAGNEPQTLMFFKSDMRKHLLKCFTGRKMETFPREIEECKDVWKDKIIICPCWNTQ